jgi:MFS family permease
VERATDGASAALPGAPLGPPSEPSAAPATGPPATPSPGPPAAEPVGLRRFYAYQVVAEFYFTGGIWILYLQSRGFSLAEIGLAESVFHLAPVTLELPSGSIADVLGRKWSLVAGCLLGALSAALMLQADSLLWLLPAMFLGGASYAFRSGATQAFLYDNLAAGDGAGRYAGLWGRLLSVSYVVIAATTWLGAFLADRSFVLPYALTITSGLAAAGLAAGLREPPRERSAHRSLTRTVAEALRIVRGHPGLAAMLAFGAGLATLLTLIGLYAQAVFAEYGLPPSQIGFIIGSTLLFTALGSWFSGRIGVRVGFVRATVATTIATVGAGLGLGSGVLALAVGLYLLAELITGVFEPLLSDRINRGLPAAQRATILSVEGFLFSVTMIWAFPLFGAAAGRVGWLAAYAGAGLVVLALLAAWVFSDGRDRRRAAV